MARASSMSNRVKKVCDVVKPKKTSTALFPPSTEKISKEFVQEKARGLGLSLDGRVKKENAIRAIQIAEGYKPCFNTQEVETCGQKCCCWREECRG